MPVKVFVDEPLEHARPGIKLDAAVHSIIGHSDQVRLQHESFPQRFVLRSCLG